MSSDNRILVGDVGGTHARFAVVEPVEGGPWRILHRLDLAERFATFDDALRSYLERAGVSSAFRRERRLPWRVRSRRGPPGSPTEGG